MPIDLLEKKPRDLLAPKDSLEEPKKSLPVQFLEGMLEQHLRPAKAILQPITQSLGFRKPSEVLKEQPFLQRRPERFGPAYAREIARGVIPTTADILTTPLTYALPGLSQAGTKALMASKARPFIQKYLPTFFKGALAKTSPEFLRYQNWLKTFTPLSSRGTASKGAVGRITLALKQAKPLRGEQEALYTAERAKRVAKIVEIGKKVPGEKGYFSQLKALKGELPKLQFEGIRKQISQVDVDEVFRMVEENQMLLPFEKITAKAGLTKLLGEGGAIPTEKQLELLRQIFPQDFIKTVLLKRQFLNRIGDVSGEVLNVPRAMMASTDMSFLFRQGIFLAPRHPKIFAKTLKEQFKYFFSEKAYRGLMFDIRSRPTYPLMRQARLPLTEIGAPLAGREEAFMSQLAEKIPLVGKVIRASNRAYTGAANKIRVDVFDWMINTAQKLKIPLTDKLLTDIGREFVGSATGRGSIGQLERAAVILNSVFFSPRLMAARINLMNPYFYTKLHPFVRKEALKSLFLFGGTALTIFGLAKMGGAKVGAEPRSADFAKIKVGNTRYDPLGGFQQYIRAAAQLISGEHISSTTGVKTTMGEGYKPLTRMDIITRFIETKEAPILSFITSLLKGRTAIGKELKIPREIGLRFTPMVIQDMYDLYQERGLEGLGMTLPAIFGVGVQTYSPDASEMVYSTNSVKRNVTQLLNQGRVGEARTLYLKNRELIKKGERLEPFQKDLSKFKRGRDIVLKNVTISPTQKQEGLSYIDRMIQRIGSRMEREYEEIK